MKRLILDHYRRWSWALVLCAVLEFCVGLSIADPLVPKFWDFLLTMWTGPFLLSFDIRRGILRPVAALPLTNRLIGRGWWLATVPIPAIALNVLLFLGTATVCHFNPDQSFPIGRLAVASLFNFVWLGISFTMIFNATSVWYGGPWGFNRNSLVSMLSFLAFFGSMVLCQDASEKPFKAAVLLGVGGVLTVVGWLRAEQFELRCAGFCLSRIELSNLGTGGMRLASLETGVSPGACRAPKGYGGIPFLISTAFLRPFLTGLAMVALIPVLMTLQGHMKSWQEAIQSMTYARNMFWFLFIVYIQLVPTMPHLRYLRTLPFSTTRLTAVMFTMAVLPLITLSALVAGAAGLFLDAPAAVTMLKSYAPALAPAALCVFFAVWRGDTTEAFVMLLFVMMALGAVPVWWEMLFHHREIPSSITTTSWGSCVLLSFLLTRFVLGHSSRAYRVQSTQANLFGNVPWRTSR